jgi:hypothetical protein
VECALQLIKHKANHFALRAKLFIKATQQALAQLKNLRAE